MYEQELALAKLAKTPLMKCVKFFALPGETPTSFGKSIKETMTSEEIQELGDLIDKA